MSVYVFTTGLPPPPPMMSLLSRLAYYASIDGRHHPLHRAPRLLSTDYFAAMAIQLCHRCWAPSSSLLADVSAADWFLRLHVYATSSPSMGVIVFTTTNIFVTSDGRYHPHVRHLAFMSTASAIANGQFWLWQKDKLYMLRGLSTQTQGSYLQFGLVLNTCNMNSWLWVGFSCSTTGLLIIPHEGHQLSICASQDSIFISIFGVCHKG